MTGTLFLMGSDSGREGLWTLHPRIVPSCEIDFGFISHGNFRITMMHAESSLCGVPVVNKMILSVKHVDIFTVNSSVHLLRVLEGNIVGTSTAFSE